MAAMTPTAPATTAPSLVAQPSLLGWDEPGFDPSFAGIERRYLGRGAWIELLPGWLRGHDELFARLLELATWEGQRRPMYDRMVDVPRLIGTLPEDHPRLAVLPAMARAIGAHLGTELCRIGVSLYRDGADSVAWHGDQVARELPQSVMATVSVGEPRPFCLRPKGGGLSQRFPLGAGDLLVMGGSIQRTWDHAVPKVARAGPRIVVMLRPRWEPASAPTPAV